MRHQFPVKTLPLLSFCPQDHITFLSGQVSYNILSSVNSQHCSLKVSTKLYTSQICSKMFNSKVNCPKTTIYHKLLKFSKLALLGSYRKPKHSINQKYSRLICLLLVKGLVICFYLGWSGNTLLIAKHIIKVGSKSQLLTCSSNKL